MTMTKQMDSNSRNCKSVHLTLKLTLFIYIFVFFSTRLQLRINCNGSNNAIVTQENTPVGSKIVFDKDRTVIPVTPELFNILIKVCFS